MLGELEVRVDGEMATLVEGGNLAGSVTAMDLELCNVVRSGIPLVEAVRSAAANPAGLLGLTDRGRLSVGLRADLVELDAGSFAVRRVMREGEWIVGT
jgi:N-acetylglucosamine-6-phosphate deacetylase